MRKTLFTFILCMTNCLLSDRIITLLRATLDPSNPWHRSSIFTSLKTDEQLKDWDDLVTSHFLSGLNLVFASTCVIVASNKLPSLEEAFTRIL